MQSLSDFPVELNRTFKHVNYETEEERNQVIEFLAERISGLLSECLTKRWHETRDSRSHLKHMFYINHERNFPSEEMVNQYRKDLKDTIITCLNTEYRSSKDYSRLKFDAEGVDEDKLYGIFKKNEIQEKTNTFLCDYYPQKLGVLLSDTRKIKEIEVMISYR